MRRGRRSHKRLAATERELERREASPQLFDVGPLPAVAAAPGGSLSPREGVPLPQNVTVYPNALTPRRGERDVIVHDDSAPEDEEGEANPLESSVETRDDQEEEKGEEWEGPSPPPASQHAPRDGRSVGSMRWLEEAMSPPRRPESHSHTLSRPAAGRRIRKFRWGGAWGLSRGVARVPPSLRSPRLLKRSLPRGWARAPRLQVSHAD